MELKGQSVTINDNGNTMVISSPMKDRVMFSPHSGRVVITYEQLKEIVEHFAEKSSD